MQRIKEIFKVMCSIEKDKLLHSFYGTLLFSISLIWFSSFFALSIVIVCALVKEIYDEYTYGGFDWKDIIFTIMIPLILTLGM